VEAKLDELFTWYDHLENVALGDIAEFHFRFELIHPFQDGNGRIGRFLMLKQMLENNLPILIVTWDNEDSYRNSLDLCTIGDYRPLNAYLKTLTDFRECYKEFWA
jgi:Fic family protein